MPGNGKKSFMETIFDLVDHVLQKAAGTAHEKATPLDSSPDPEKIEKADSKTED